jgi:hypothetical protein
MWVADRRDTKVPTSRTSRTTYLIDPSSNVVRVGAVKEKLERVIDAKDLIKTAHPSSLLQPLIYVMIRMKKTNKK